MKLNTKTKVIFVTGGVFSSLGKGIASSCIANILKYYHFNVLMIKFDPYLNIDAGTMSPEQHGEVFVTYDGKETDLDIGNYERFLNIDLPKESNITAGSIYFDVLKKERDGEFLGSTIQVVPNITNLINQKIIDLANKNKSDFIIVEIGGTIGDIESIPFIESLRQFQSTYKNQTLIAHVVPLISLLASNEIKTKPLQHSVKCLMSYGIFPNLLLVRSKKLLSQKLKNKITFTTGINADYIYSLPNVQHIYLLTEVLKKQDFHFNILNYFNLSVDQSKNDHKWDEFIALIQKEKKHDTKIAIVGKYNEGSDQYLSIFSSLEICSFYLNSNITIDFINSSTINENNVSDILKNYTGVIVPGGFGHRDIYGKIIAIQYCRLYNIPFLGICLGMQLACIEYARNVLKIEDVNSTEFDPNTKHPLITILAGKKHDRDLGGSLRLGNYKCHLKKGTKAYQCYAQSEIIERHRHRYEFNTKYLS